MTKNKAKKKDIRERMKETGESYTVALHHLEPKEPTLWELGEDGDSWFIEGTTDPDIAMTMLKKWINETVPDLYEEYLESLSKYSKQTVRTDWFWQPLLPEYPDDESLLRYKSGHDYKGQTLFKGVHITI